MLKPLKANCFRLEQKSNLHYAEKCQNTLNLLNKICFLILTKKIPFPNQCNFFIPITVWCLQSALIQCFSVQLRPGPHLIGTAKYAK